MSEGNRSAGTEDPNGVLGQLDKAVRDNISRLVAWVLAPALAILIPPVTNAVNTALGTGYNDQQLSNIAIAAIVGTLLALWAWLRGRAQFETAATYVKERYDEGKALERGDLSGQPDDSTSYDPDEFGPPPADQPQLGAVPGQDDPPRPRG